MTAPRATHVQRRAHAPLPATGRLAIGPADVALVSAAGSWAFDGKDTLHPLAHGLDDAVDLLTKGTSVDGAAFPERLAAWRLHFETGAIEVSRATPVVRLFVEGSLNHLDVDLYITSKDYLVRIRWENLSNRRILTYRPLYKKFITNVYY
jgi:hypothetical protein